MAGVGSDDVGDALARVTHDLAARLDMERRLNDADAPRITDIEVMLHAVDSARHHIGGAEAQAA